MKPGLPSLRLFPLVLTLALSAAVAQPALPQSVAGKGRPPVPQDTEDLATLTLVKSTDGTAVIRFAEGPLRIVTPGDRLGRQRAEVIEIAAGRLVLEEVFAGADGQPNRAQIVVKDGQTGGRRFVKRLDQPRPATIRTEASTLRVR